MHDPTMTPQRLRELAAWYREFSEKTGNPMIWESRLQMAKDLESEADRMEKDGLKGSAEAMQKTNE